MSCIYFVQSDFDLILAKGKMDESMVKHSELEIWMKCHIIQNKGTLVFHGVQVNIGCDLHVQRHMHDTCLAYWI